MTTTDQRPISSLSAQTSPAGAATAGTRQESFPADDPRTVEALVGPVARYAVEIIRDMRSEKSLARLVTPEVGMELGRRAALTRRLRNRTGYAPSRQLDITGIRICVVNPRTVEASCVLREPDRARFLAMRWELRHSGWRVTVLEIG